MSFFGRPRAPWPHSQPRAACAADLVHLAALAARAGERPPPAADAEANACAATQERFSAALQDAAQQLWVVAGPDGLAAAVHFLFVADELEVVDVWVDRAHRRRGLAARLLRAASAAAHARGARVALLDVRRGNAAARALYASLGFSAVGVRRSYYRPHPADALVADVGEAARDALLLRATLPLADAAP